VIQLHVMNRAQSDEPPVLILYQKWALGMLAVKVWARAVTVDALSSLANDRLLRAAAPDSWRARLEQLMRMPLRQLPFLWTLCAIIWPLVKVHAPWVVAIAPPPCCCTLLCHRRCVLSLHRRYGLSQP